MHTTPLTDRFGVEVHDIDLGTLDADNFAQVRDAFETHSALLFRNQTIDDAAHMRLALMFGPIEDRETDTLEVGKEFKVPRVSNVREDGSVTPEMDLHTLSLKANMLWHADSTFLPKPALVNILIGRVVTETGGATELACTRAGWADMPPALKDRIRDRAVWHRLSHSRARLMPELAALPMFHKCPLQLLRAVCRNPVKLAQAHHLPNHSFPVVGVWHQRIKR